MKHKILLDFLKNYGNISEQEEQDIRNNFVCKNVSKKEILIHCNSVCDKLFFINFGLLRTYYLDSEGNEFTRRIAWEKGFLTNMDSFRKNGIENNETIECIESAEILEISKFDLDNILSCSENLAKIYQTILEKYMAINIRRYQHISSSTPMERLIYFNENFPNIKNRVNDSILASFLSISRITLLRTKKNITKK